MRTIAIIRVAMLLAVAWPAAEGLCDSGAGTSITSPTLLEDGPRLTRTVLKSGLGDPWDLAFTPDGEMLFTEKCRGLSVLRKDGSVRRLFGSRGSAVVAEDFLDRKSVV